MSFMGGKFGIRWASWAANSVLRAANFAQPRGGKFLNPALDPYKAMSTFLDGMIMRALSPERGKDFAIMYNARLVDGDGDCELEVMLEFLEREKKAVETIARTVRLSTAAAADVGQQRKSTKQFGKHHGYSETSRVSDSDSESNQVKQPEGREFFTSAAMDEASD